ncbi:phosphatase PAP2 family protein [Streptomyces tsukubensis]
MEPDCRSGPGDGGHPPGRPTGGAAPAVPPPLRTALGPVAAFGALLVAVLGLLYADRDRPGAIDERIVSAVADVRPPWRYAALAVDFLAEPAGAAILVVAAVTGCLLLRHLRAAVLFVVGTGLTVATTKLLKPLVGRTINGEFLSYPSGHTAFLTAFAVMVALLAAGRFGLGRTAGILLVLAAALVAGAAMGWAQVALNAHYPTDTLGGWGTALAVIPATAWLVDRFACTERGAMSAEVTGGPDPAGRREQR